MSFLPTTIEEGKKYYKDFKGFDVIIISGDPYYDHPLSGTAIIARLLDRKGYKTAIIPQPLVDKEYKVCGQPKYFFCITSGLLDSMLANYTPMLKQREDVLVPERGLIVYTQKIKELFKGSMTVLGGVEATIRRFTHFDYRDNELRRGILNDTKADVLLFGSAERPILELLDSLTNKKKWQSIEGLACRIKKDEIPKDIPMLPSYENCVKDKAAFNKLTKAYYLNPDSAFVEPCGVGFILHNKPAYPLTEKEMDYVYALTFTRLLHPGTKNKEMNEAAVEKLQTSIVIGKGCWGGCSFCILPLVQGKNIAKRSKYSILREIEYLYKKGFRIINDLTLPTLNMYGSSCELYYLKHTIHSLILDEDVTVYEKTVPCNQKCITCKHRILNDDLLDLLQDVEKLNKKYHGSLELRSAVRHDIILNQKKLFRKIMQFVTRLKIAPEHISDYVLNLMNKSDKVTFDAFLDEYNKINEEQRTHKHLVPYFVAAHPGCGEKEMHDLAKYCKQKGLFVNLTQIFTPTPGTLSTAMYYTGEHPITKEKVYVARTFRQRKDQKNILVPSDKFDDDV
ncbi:MAG: YgiQ family radical SAM protein [Candidatus Woesearchaeota archaeon]|jgi:uncharacterized radical SAM protein YgiQ